MSTTSQSIDTDPATIAEPSNNSTSRGNTFEYISSYNFASDLEFRKGLGTILGHPETPASDKELSTGTDVVLQAKCFYISRKQNISPSIDFKSYKKWLIENPGNQSPNNKAAIASSSTAAVLDEKSEKAEPAYPSSFAHIVDLITNNQPIPGIEEIPDTVLLGHDEPSKATRRQKPWEKAEVADNTS